VLIRSANDSAGDVARYSERAHGFLTKVHRVCVVRSGQRAVGCGLWAVGCGLWAVRSGW